MRLTGLVHSSAVTGDEDVYVEVRDLAVVLGANDSAKTRSLLALHESLRHCIAAFGGAADPAPICSPRVDATLFFDLSDLELGSECAYALFRIQDPEDPVDLTWWGLDDDVSDILDEFDEHLWDHDADAIDAWVSVVRKGAGLTAERFDPLFAALKEARSVAVFPPQEAGQEEISAFLTLPPAVAGAEAIRSLLEEIDCEPETVWPVPVLPCPLLNPTFPAPIWAPVEPEAIEGALLAALVPCVRAMTLLERSNPSGKDGPRGGGSVLR